MWWKKIEKPEWKPEIKVFTEEEYHEVVSAKESLVGYSSALEREKNSLQSDLNCANEEIKKLKAIVREQTESDIFVNALRGLGIIPKPTPEYDAGKEQQRLMAQAQMAQSSYHLPYGTSNYPWAGMAGVLWLGK
jgi:hypothetical protein